MNKKLIIVVAVIVALAGIAGLVAKNIHGNTDEKNPVVVKTRHFYSTPGVKKVEEKYPHIRFERDTTSSIDNVTPEAVIISGQFELDALTSLRECIKYAKIGCVADITDLMDKFGYTKSILPEYLETVTYEGKIYGIPKWTYHMGLVYNKKIFEEAGLVDENGYPLYPDTYEELAQTAVKIKERTGKSAIFWPNIQGQGGWSFMNLAWSYGVEFMEEKDGKVMATFNTPECVEALQYIKDLRWKYDVLQEEIFGDEINFTPLFEQGEVAMGFTASTEIDRMTGKIDDKFNTVAFSKMPAGPAGRYSLRGGTIIMLSPKATYQQKEAVFYWLRESGFSSDTDKESRKIYEEICERKNRIGEFTGYTVDSVFKSEEHRKMCNEIENKYLNFDYKLIENFADDDDVIYKMEYEHYIQELYRILDVALQTVMTDENADCEQLIAEASEKFQTQYLDKLNNR